MFGGDPFMEAAFGSGGFNPPPPTRDRCVIFRPFSTHLFSFGGGGGALGSSLAGFFEKPAGQAGGGRPSLTGARAEKTLLPCTVKMINDAVVSARKSGETTNS